MLFRKITAKDLKLASMRNELQVKMALSPLNKELIPVLQMQAVPLQTQTEVPLQCRRNGRRITIFPHLHLSDSFMDGFAFITETDGSSGKVASATARRPIRTHVMRTHWANKTGSGDPGFDVSIQTSESQIGRSCPQP